MHAHTDAALQTEVEVLSERFQSENVTVTLKWVQGVNDFYNVQVVPPVYMYYNDSTTVELTLLYNILYSVTIIAYLCEYNTTDVTEFLYGKCYLAK